MAEDLPSENVIPSVGEPKIDYCLRCHTMAVQTAAIYAITSKASHVIGMYAICGECGWSPYEADQAWRERAEKAETAAARARALADRWCHEPHPTHDHSCPDDLRRELLAALDDTRETEHGG